MTEKNVTQEKNITQNQNPAQAAEEISYHVIRPIGILSTSSNGWSKEINLISWNDGRPKYDIRDWSPDHAKMTKGLRITAFEAKQLRSILNSLDLDKPLTEEGTAAEHPDPGNRTRAEDADPDCWTKVEDTEPDCRTKAEDTEPGSRKKIPDTDPDRKKQNPGKPPEKGLGSNAEQGIPF